VFEGGRRKASADQSAALYRELAARYQAVVLNSFREVEDALITIEKQGQYLEELKLQAAATEKLLRVANDRYLRGLSQYLVLVTAQTAYFNAETELIIARRGLMDAYISFFISLGGDMG
jgi:outer membrane protein TolC